MTIIWDGFNQAKKMQADEHSTRQKLAHAAKAYRWSDVLAILAERPDLINTTRPDGGSLYAPLHQAAHGGAPLKVIEHLLEIGAWRTLKNSRGETALTVAWTHRHFHLMPVLHPHYKHYVPPEVLLKIQMNFHKVIRARADKFDGMDVSLDNLRLPELEPLLELERPRMWFRVYEMYGGYEYWLEPKGQDTKLMSEFTSTHGWGSERPHEITETSIKLVVESLT